MFFRQRMLIAQKNMNQWTHVILDEVHEREEDMDLVMLICKKLLLTNSRGTKVSPGCSCVPCVPGSCPADPDVGHHRRDEVPGLLLCPASWTDEA